jgi:hypothetical protein
VRMPHLRFHVRTLLILVALLAVFLGSAIRVVRWMEDGHAVFLRGEAAAYAQAERECRRLAADAARRGDRAHAAAWAMEAEANSRAAKDTRALLAEYEAMRH